MWSNSAASWGPTVRSAAAVRQVEQQVVEVEQPQRALAHHVVAADGSDLGQQLGAPGRALVDDLAQRPAGVDGAGVEVEQDRLARETSPGRVGHEVVVTHEVDEVGRVAGVEDREALGQAERVGMVAQHAVGHRVERAALHPAVAPAAAASHAGEQGLAAGQHLPGGAAGEGQQQDALGRRAGLDQPRHPAGQGRGLARARAGQDAQRGVAHEARGGALLVVQPRQRLEHVFDYIPRLSIRVRTRRSMSSTIPRTVSRSWPWGSATCQSS